MSAELKIIEKIKEANQVYDIFLSQKLSAPTIGKERAILLEMEKKKSYIEGLTDALSIMQAHNTNFQK